MKPDQLLSPQRTLAVTRRVLEQLHHDKRTIALVLLVPSLLMILLRYVYDGADTLFKSVAPLILGLFPFIIMFLVTSVAMLRERTTGTLERLMTLPVAKLDLLLGYALAFGGLAVLQGALASWVTTGLLGVGVDGGAWRLVLVAALTGVTGSATGLFFSAFAKTEFQAVQFMPAFIFPQLLTSGLLVARDKMHVVLERISDYFPLTYIVDAMKQVAGHTGWPKDLVHDLWTVALFALGALVLGAATLRRSRR